MPDQTVPDRAGGDNRIDLVLLDVGGPIYDDAAYRDALWRAVRELTAANGDEVTEAEFLHVYDTQRQAQQGSLRTAMAKRFLTADDRTRLSELAQRYWEYPPSALHSDVLPTLRELAQHYRIAVAANQRAVVMDALHRDGVAEYIDVWAISELVGVEKPDPALFEHVLTEAKVEAAHAVHVGNRLDTDVRGAHRVGLRAVWVLRGEAPPHPTPAQLAEPDMCVKELTELPAALRRLQGAD